MAKIGAVIEKDPIANVNVLSPDVIAAIKAQLAGTNVVDPEVEISEMERGFNAAQAERAANPEVAKVLQGAKTAKGKYASVDFSDVPDFDLMDDTLDYEAEVISIKEDMSTGGWQEFTVGLKITYPATYKGRKMTDWVQIDNAKNAFRFKSFCRACDLLSDDGNRCTAESEQDFLNNVVRFKVDNKEYNGNTRSKVGATYSVAFSTPGLEVE